MSMHNMECWLFGVIGKAELNQVLDDVTFFLLELLADRDKTNILVSTVDRPGYSAVAAAAAAWFMLRSW